MEELTAYEMLDLAMGHINASVDDLNRALALGSAYLLCAYKAGRQLTRFQVSIINVGFFIFVGQAMWGATNELGAASIYYGAVENAAYSISELDDMSAWVFPIFGLVALGAIIACYAFMWSVRRPKTD